jgi:hypothetical protein
MSDLPPAPPDLPESMPEMPELPAETPTFSEDEPAVPPESTAPSEPTTPVEPVAPAEPASADWEPILAPRSSPPPSLEPYQTAPLTEQAEQKVALANASSAQPQPFGPDHCPRCGGQDFVSGQLLSYGGRFRPAYYKPRRLSFFRLNNLLRPFRALAEVEALVCRTCGLVLCQVDTERLARIEPRK